MRDERQIRWKITALDQQIERMQQARRPGDESHIREMICLRDGLQWALGRATFPITIIDFDEGEHETLAKG